MEERITVEVKHLLDILYKKSSEPFNPADPLYVSSSNIIFAILFNKRFSLDDKGICQQLEDLRVLGRLFWESAKLKFIPFIRHLPYAKDIVKSLIQHNMSILQFIREELDQHAKTYTRDAEATNFVAGYKNKMADDYNEEMLVFIIRDLFAAGSDTTPTSLLWAMIFMANNPDKQARVHKELDDTIGRDILPTLASRRSLSYVEAVLHESFRLGSMAPLALPHSTLDITELFGYRMKRDTMVCYIIISIYSPRFHTL